jgi:hypothetical protein
MVIFPVTGGREGHRIHAGVAGRDGKFHERVWPAFAACGTVSLVTATSCVLTRTVLEVEAVRPSNVVTVSLAV